MVGVVSSIPTGGNFSFCWNFLKLLDINIVQKCQICVENKNLSYNDAGFHFMWSEKKKLNRCHFLVPSGDYCEATYADCVPKVSAKFSRLPQHTKSTLYPPHHLPILPLEMKSFHFQVGLQICKVLLYPPTPKWNVVIYSQNFRFAKCHFIRPPPKWKVVTFLQNVRSGFQMFIVPLYPPPPN